MQEVDRLDLQVPIHGSPHEVDDSIRFVSDETHGAYGPGYANCSRRWTGIRRRHAPSGRGCRPRAGPLHDFSPFSRTGIVRVIRRNAEPPSVEVVHRAERAAESIGGNVERGQRERGNSIAQAFHAAQPDLVALPPGRFPDVPPILMADLVCDEGQQLPGREEPSKALAKQLNAERCPGRGGAHWNPSTIHGNPARGTGILNNELYVRRLVWNRLRYVKDPDTGKRVSRPNPRSEWVTTVVPELRIIDDEPWNQVKARQVEMRRVASSGDPKRFN